MLPSFNCHHIPSRLVIIRSIFINRRADNFIQTSAIGKTLAVAVSKPPCKKVTSSREGEKNEADIKRTSKFSKVSKKYKRYNLPKWLLILL